MSKIKFSVEETKINLLTQKEFSQRQLEITKGLIKEEAYPTYFGPDLPKGSKFLEFRIVDVDDIKDDTTDQGKIINKMYGAQVARATDNPKRAEIHNDILTNGYKLRCLPIQVRQNADGSYSPSNGRTRLDLFRQQNITRVLVAVYTYETDVAFITHSIQANCENDPAGNAKMGDVIAAGQTLIDNKMLKSDLDSISNWVYTATGSGIFTDQKKDEIAISIYNNKLTRPYIYSWNQETISNWMHSHGFEKASELYPNINIKKMSGLYYDNRETTPDKDKNKYLYMVASYSTPAKNLWRAAEIMSIKQFKGKELRIVIHTSVLGTSSSFADLKKMYQSRLDEHEGLFEKGLNNFSKSFFRGASVDMDIELWASLPAIKGEHNLDNFVF